MASAHADRGSDDHDDFEFEALGGWDPVASWEAQIREAVRLGFNDMAEGLREAGPPPGPGLTDFILSPRILAIEVGGDPGGALAVATAALDFDQLQLVIVMGDPEAARFTRHLLDLLDRSHIGVVASSAPAPRELSLVGLIPPDVPPQPTDVLSAVRAIAASYPYVIRWGNYGALTDLATVYAAEPELADRLWCAIAAGPADTVPFASDPASAVAAFATLHRPPREHQDPRVAGGSPGLPHLLTTDINDYRLAPGSETERMLAGPAAPAWAHMLAAHFSQWFAQGHPAASLHPVLTVGELDDIAYFDHEAGFVSIDADGRVHIGQTGVEMWTSGGPVDYPITYWLHNVLGFKAT